MRTLVALLLMTSAASAQNYNTLQGGQGSSYTYGSDGSITNRVPNGAGGYYDYTTKPNGGGMRNCTSLPNGAGGYYTTCN